LYFVFYNLLLLSTLLHFQFARALDAIKYFLLLHYTSAPLFQQDGHYRDVLLRRQLGTPFVFLRNSAPARRAKESLQLLHREMMVAAQSGTEFS